MQSIDGNEEKTISRTDNKAPSMRTKTTTAERSNAQGARRTNVQRRRPANAGGSSTSNARMTSEVKNNGRTSAPTKSNANRDRTSATRNTTVRSNNNQPVSRKVNNKKNIKKTKAKGKGFKRFLTIYAIILALILIIGLIIFNSFIGNYEKNQPSNVAKNVVDELSSANAATYLQSNAELIPTIEDKNQIIDKYLSSISGKELSYVENSDSRADAPSFDIRGDGQTFGKIMLVDNGTGSFGLKQWKLGSIDIASSIPDTYSYTILAPTGYTVAINGNDLPESDITAKDETPEILANTADFIKDVPKYDAYTASGLLTIPEVTAKDADGKDVGVAVATEYFVAGGEPTKEFIDEQKDFVESALHDWAYHFIHYNTDEINLAYYIQSGSELYSYIFGSDEMDPIVTSFYDWENITNVDFTEFEAGNYIKYTDDCYSVDVKYRLKVDFNNDKLSDDAQMLDATWVIVKKNNFWGICDVIYHQGSEDTLTQEAQNNGTDATQNDNKDNQNNETSAKDDNAQNKEDTSANADDANNAEADDAAQDNNDDAEQNNDDAAGANDEEL